MSVTWTLNGNSKYEVSSKEHLLQLMNKGSLYTDAGAPPTDYWASDYEQTVDIDLETDTNIFPIGIFTDRFTGSYDGGNFSVSNWSYNAGANDSIQETHVGLFGYFQGTVIENLKLEGVWSATATGCTGFLAGYVLNGTVRNIECTYAEGTTLTGTTSYGGTNCAGGAIGDSNRGILYQITVKGKIFTPTAKTSYAFGGVVGQLKGDVTGLRNCAFWPDSPDGTQAGGIVGRIWNVSTVTNALNAMVGDFSGNHAGGIAGVVFPDVTLTTVVNSMRGSMSGISTCGGIVGYAYLNSADINLVNAALYMTGDVVHSGRGGGMIGWANNASSVYSVDIANSVNAMNGNVGDAAIAEATFTPTVSMKIDTSFGLTYTTATYGSTSDVVTGTTPTLLPEFTYTPLVFSDDLSNSYEYEIVFGNVGGHSSYSQYTHAIISKNDIAGPYAVDFDLTSDTTEFVTYLNTDSNSAYTDGSLTILDSTAQVVYNYAGATLYPIVEWVLDANSKYEISSKEHLLQLMNNGTYSANAGTPPTSYKASSYIQTVDIDLEGDSTNIVPISTFTGEYDGNGFTISNWSYVDPNFGTGTPSTHVGLFGYVNGGTVKNVTLDGVCTLSGWVSNAGMVIGYARNATVSNIDCNLSSGSYMTQGDSVSVAGWTTFGTTIGAMHSGTHVAITFRGEMGNMTGSTNVTSKLVGGVVGQTANGSHTLIRNLGTFPNGIGGSIVGGVLGQATGVTTKLLCAMTGDLNGEYNTGGVIANSVVADTSGEFINSMKGNVTSEKSYSGGIFGDHTQAAASTMSSLMNYMGGNISSTDVPDRAGGMVGDGRNTNLNFATSINAMNGDVYNTVLGRDFAVTDLAFVATSFGLTFTTDDYGTTTPITGLPTDSETGLPIVDLTATDADGVVHTFEFVFGNGPRLFNQLQIKALGDNFNMNELEVYNLAGENIALLGTASTDSVNSSSNESRGNDGITDSDSAFTIDLILTGGPTWILDLDREYTLSEIHKVVFYNRITFTTRAVGAIITLHSADGGDPEQIGVLTADLVQEYVITDVPLTVVPRALSAITTVSPVGGATAYRITTQKTGSTRERTAKNGFTDLNQTIYNLVPETEYTLRLYSTSGGGYSLVHAATVTTLENSASNYNANDFLGADGRFDLSSLDTTSVGFIADVMNDIFTTGDSIDISVPGGRSGATKSKFVNRGANVSIEDSEALVAPFSKDAGAGQSVSLTLSDSSIVSVAFDETTEAVTVGATSYTSGDSFVLDGKKATIIDI